MQVLNDNIFNLLSADMVYKVPRYQRQYSWQESPHCETLWKDIETIIKQNNTYGKNVSNRQINHFLGTIVTVEIHNSEISDFDFGLSSHLIDGQQRLTSLSLMIIALRHYVHKKWELEPNNVELKRFEDALVGLLDRKPGKYKAKLELSSSDQEAYISLLKNSEQIEKRPSPNASLLLKNCRYFYYRWKSLFEGKDHFVLSEQSIKPMFECLQFAYIKLDPQNEDNPQQVFESLNSTGINLSQADLIRNFLLMEMSVERQRELYEEYWCLIEKNIEHYAGNAQKIPDLLTQFFLHFLTIQNADIPVKDNLYAKFKNWFEVNYNCISNANRQCLEQLVEANKIWCNMYWSQSDSKSEIERKCFELRQLDRDVLNPVIFMFLYDCDCGRITEETLCWCLKFFCSYCLRLFAQGDDVGNKMNGSFCNLMSKLKKANTDRSYLQTLVDHLCQDGATDDNKLKLKCPNDSEFKRWLLNHSISSTSQEKQYVAIMLFVTERFENKEIALLPEKYALDFILPADLADRKVDLKPELGWDPELLELSGHQEWSGRLGNLTLRNKDKPLPKDRARWSEFKDRQAELGQLYKRHLNKELQGDKDTWTVQDIKERGERLADLIIKVLPYPDMSLVK